MKPAPPEHLPFHRDPETLQAGLDDVRLSPQDEGQLVFLVSRRAAGERDVLDAGDISLETGLQGDNWMSRGSSRTADGSANPEAQVTVMNVRAARLVAATDERVPLAGDQLYVDLDLSTENLPTGTLLEVGEVALEVTAEPHTGCAQFSARFGVDALRLTATPDGRFLRLRGINTRVVRPGRVAVGDTVRVTRPA